MIDRPADAGTAAPARAGVEGRRRAAMSARDVAVLRSLADRIDPADPGAHNNLGVVFFQKGLVEDAVAAFERALDLDPRLDVARTNLRIAFTRTDHFQRRVTELLAHLAERPEDAEARDALARTSLLGGDAEGAAREWGKLLESHPDSVPLHMKLAHAEAERGHHAEAERLLRRAVGLAPGEAAVHAQLAELRWSRGDLSGAAASAERAVALAPDDARVHTLLADLLDELGRAAEAASVRERASALDPAVLEAEAHLSLERYFAITAVKAERDPAGVKGELGHTARAIELRRQGDLDGAMAALDEALAAGEDEMEVRQSRAELTLLRGDLAAAAAEYEVLLRHRPESPKLWNERGVALHRAGAATEALDAYRHAVASDAAYALAWNNLGVALAQGGDPAGAEKAFRKAAEADPPAEVLWNFGLYLGRQGRAPEAVDVCRVALEADEDAAESWTRLGSALFQAGRPPEARDALLRALELDPDQAEARYQLGFTLSALGDFPGALRETKRALELDPLFPAPVYRLLIDVQFESGSLPAPEREGERVRPGSPVASFHPDAAALDEAFAGMAVQPPARPATSRPALDAARLALRRGQPRRAAALAAEARAADPAALEALLLEGRAQLDLGLAGEALERFDAVLAAGATGDADEARLGRARALLLLGRPAEAAEAAAVPAGPEALAVRGRALLAAGDAAGAIVAYEAALGTGPEDVPSLTGLGEALLAAGRPADAEPVLRRALARNPAAVAARVGLGRALAALGDARGAESEYEAAVRALPSYGDAVLRLAEIRWRERRRPAALRGLVALLELDPMQVPALVRLGTWLYELGRPEKAEAALRRALRFDPENAGARAELERIARREGGHAD